MRLGRVAGAAALALLAGAVIPLAVSAHALPQSSIPAPGSTVQQAPSSVLIVFGEAPDLQISTITVVNSSGGNVDAGPTAPVPAKPLELEVPLQPHLPDGVYTVTWKTVSSVDGHLATGTFAFGVGVSTAAVPRTAVNVGATAPSPFAVVMRLLLFVGVIVVVGAVVLGFAAFGSLPVLLRRVILIAAVIAGCGTLGVVASQIQSAGLGLGAFVGSSLGRAFVARAVPALVMLVAALTLLRIRSVAERWVAALAGVAALAVMGVDVLNSHAAAESPAPLNEVAQWLHIVAVGVWIGGLVALLVSVAGEPTEHKADVARRLSLLAGFGLLIVAATGVFRAVIEVQTWAGLVTTAFGVLVLLKIGLLVILAGLGALNRYGNLPRLPRTMHRLRRMVSTEVLVALGALTVAAALVNVAPPVEYASAGSSQNTGVPANLVVTGSDYATTVKVRLTVTPGTPGFNTFNMQVTDYDTGASVSASSVVLQFMQPFRPSLAPSSLTLSRQSDGSFQARGANLSLPGLWQVAAIVENGTRSTEVHLQLTTVSKPPVIQVTPFPPPDPTVYTIQLSPSLSAQVYVDPDKPGADEFHVTFITSQGSEVPIASCAVGETTPGGTPTLLVVRRLDDIGHFVADATVPSGSTRFDLIATTRSGQSIWTYINITPRSK